MRIFQANMQLQTQSHDNLKQGLGCTSKAKRASKRRQPLNCRCVHAQAPAPPTACLVRGMQQVLRGEGRELRRWAEAWPGAGPCH